MLGALLVFDVNDIRYLTSTMIGEWARDKMARYALLARGAEPVVWDFGSAARHHQLHAPWLRPENSRAGMLGLRGSVAPKPGSSTAPPRRSRGSWTRRAWATCRSTPAQRDAYLRAREWIDAAIAAVKPGVGTDEIARLWPKAPDFGFPDEMAAFGLQFGHGLGLALHERPIISRLNSLEHPVELKAGMVFALETYCPAADGYPAARIEEEVVLTEDGPRVITLFPAEELFVANPY